jgi:protein-disulfide isomerase
MTIGGGYLALPVSARDHIVGPPTARVTMVEYGDYECPYCGAAHVVLQELLRRVGHEIRFVFRHFPLTRIHPHAQPAAEAAEAAGAPGKFWEMHDMLYEHQTALDGSHLLMYAAALDLDVKRFAEELATHAHADRVREDFMSGVRSGVNGTPSFFINGHRHDGGYDLESLLAAIASAAAAAPAPNQPFIPGGQR